MADMFKIAQQMVIEVEKQGAKVAVACVGISTVTLKALYAGVWFEYAYADSKLTITCNGEIIEEMSYSF